jgi:ribosome maturation factor RimP
MGAGRKGAVRLKGTGRIRARQHGHPPLTPAAERQIIGQIRLLAEGLCDTEGLELVHVEYRREQTGRVMRLYIDKPGGVTLEDCAAVSRELGDVLDAHLPELGPYHLEVSSPGPNRPLSQAKDFERFTGHEARIRTSAPINGQRNFTGVLAGVSGAMLRLATGEQTLELPLEGISKAHLVQ